MAFTASVNGITFYASVSPAKRPMPEAPPTLFLVDHRVRQLVDSGAVGSLREDALQVDNHQATLAHLIGEVREGVREVLILEEKARGVFTWLRWHRVEQVTVLIILVVVLFFLLDCPETCPVVVAVHVLVLIHVEVGHVGQEAAALILLALDKAHVVVGTFRISPRLAWAQ